MNQITPISNALKVFNTVIEEELSAIGLLLGHFGEDISLIVSKIATSKGRVVLCGLGKSGLIAQKIVATLNSTGTNAIYLHAADAIHGDLGVLMQEDIMICISKSGETEEFRTLLPIVRAMGIFTIALVNNIDSFLAKNASLKIVMPKIDEADPNGLAPTTSTTMQLVVGDALAIAVMTAKGFSREDFAKFHPGGQLGRQLVLKVADMCQKLDLTISPNDSIAKIILAITQGRVGACCVLDEDLNILGIITDGDLRRALSKNSDMRNILASDLISKTPKKIDKDELAVEAFAMMQNHQINQLIVTNQNQFFGFIHIQDLIKNGFC